MDVFTLGVGNEETHLGSRGSLTADAATGRSGDGGRGGSAHQSERVPHEFRGPGRVGTRPLLHWAGRLA